MYIMPFSIKNGFKKQFIYLLVFQQLTGWEGTVHVSRCPALYSGRIFVPLCRELIIFVFWNNQMLEF